MYSLFHSLDKGPVKDRCQEHFMSTNHLFSVSSRTDLRRAMVLTFRIKESLMISFVSDSARYTIAGTAANHVKMKLNGSGSCKFSFALFNINIARRL